MSDGVRDAAYADAVSRTPQPNGPGRVTRAAPVHTYSVGRAPKYNARGITFSRISRTVASVYGIHKLLWDIPREAGDQQRYLRDQDAVLDEYGIDGELRGYMKTLDFKSLYERGVNPYLLYFCAIQLEVSREDYYAQIRGERPRVGQGQAQV